MWENTVGLYNGANMGLLKTVLEINLHLFQSSKKTLILFVLRDFTGSTPLDTLSKTLMDDMERIWLGLSKVSLI
jgi:hypothetical protein